MTTGLAAVRAIWNATFTQGDRPMANTVSSVPAIFDDQLEAFVARVKSEGWDKKFSVDLKTLTADLSAQRAEKGKDLELKQAYEQHHKAHLRNQAERYARYMESLEVVRAAHRNQPDVLKSLDPYKRKSAPRKKATPKPA
jgi:uncharacterized protein YciI